VLEVSLKACVSQGVGETPLWILQQEQLWQEQCLEIWQYRQILKDSKIPLHHIVVSIINNTLFYYVSFMAITLTFSHRHLDI